MRHVFAFALMAGVVCHAATKNDDLAAFAAADTGEGAEVKLADALAMRIDPSFVTPREALPEAWRGRTAMTNFFPVSGSGDLDVIRSEAKELGGVVSVETGELAFAITGEKGEPIWSSGPLKAGETRRFAANVQAFPIVTFSTRGTGAGVWTNLVYVRDKEGWPRPTREIDTMHPLATYRLDQIKDNRDWENPFVFARNRLERHATMMVYDSEEAARAARSRADSPYFLSLDGIWKAVFSPSPDRAPADFFRPSFDDSSWREVSVPNTSELIGFGTPLFCAFGYWWMVDPPFVTRPPTSERWTVAREPNGTVSYRRTFTVPAGWKGRDVRLMFDGFGAALYVWVNGEKVGYAEDGRPGAEFDITRYVKAGANTLAVQVMRLCDGCYMEDQDYFRLSGLFRSVYLWSTPARHLEDFFVTTRRAGPDERYEGGTWVVDVAAKAPDGCSLSAALYARDRLVVRGGTRLEVRAPRLWSAETPNLYKLVLTVKDAAGRVVEAIPQTVGFREVENRGASILVNGKPVKFNGVNRHELCPETGYALTDGLIERDFRLLKQNNVNAIRLSHYPNGPRFYELANEYGFYIVDEANFESHGLSQHGWNGYCRRKGYHGVGGARNPAVDPRFRAAAMDRESGMVLRDRNQPCVTMWSLGNEIFVISDFFTEAYDAIKTLDPTRPVMNQRNGKKDLEDAMYARPTRIVEYARQRDVTRPFIPCEYEHTEGNSYGNLIDYGRAFWSSDCLQGGFLWDFADQDFPQKRNQKDVKPGQPDWRWAYGGDFGDEPGHGTGCCNGAFRADRTPSPGVPEFKYIYQDAHVVASDAAKGTFVITNRAFFTSLAKYELNWTCEDDGRAVAQGSLGRMDVPPQGGATLALTVPPCGPDVRLRTWNFVWTTAEATRGCEKGFELARDQVVQRCAEQAAGARPDDGVPCELTDGPDAVRAVCGDQVWTVSRKSGLVTSWTVGGEERLRSPIEPCLWRAPVSKERSALDQVRKIWEKAGASCTVTSFEVAKPGVVKVAFAVPTAGETTATAEYRFGKRLEVRFALRPKGLPPIRISKGWMKPLEPVPPPIPRIGMTFRVDRGFARAEWFGRGPHENYPGRTASAFFGRYALPLSDFLFPYAKPQESGSRGETYEARVTDGNGRDIRIEAVGRPFHFNVLAYTAEELERRAHQAELESCGDWIVHVDGFQRGVEGSGEGLHGDQELVAEGDYSFSFTLGK